MARKVSEQELVDLGMNKAEAKRISAELSKDPVKEYKFIAFLTTEEAQAAADLTGRTFTRASAYGKGGSKSKAK